jgi:hypothetical protein
VPVKVGAEGHSASKIIPIVTYMLDISLIVVMVALRAGTYQGSG